MTEGGEEAWAELREQGVAGVELQLFRGDDFANGRLYRSREAAREASERRRQQMIEKGWRERLSDNAEHHGCSSVGLN
jgi:hypothetical protein